MNIARQSHALRKRLERKYMRKVASHHQNIHVPMHDSFDVTLDKSDLGDYINYPPVNN